jgi:hypothetical protein
MSHRKRRRKTEMMKSIRFALITLFVFALASSAVSANEGQNLFGANSDEATCGIVLLSPSEIGEEQMDSQLDYDLTDCMGSPFDRPSILSWNCSCTLANVYLSTMGFASSVTVTPFWLFHSPTLGTLPFIGSKTYTIPPGYLAAMYKPFPPIGQNLGSFLYLAGVIHMGNPVYIYQTYSFSINCGGP